MKLTRSDIGRVVLFLLLLAGGLLQLKISLFAQGCYSRTRPHAALWRQQVDPDNMVLEARAAYLLRGRTGRTQKLLQRSLELDPLYIPAWVTLAEFEQSRGATGPAQEILGYLDRRMVDISRWRWRKTMLAYQLGDREVLARDLAYAVDELPAHRQAALDLAANLWPDPATRLEKLGVGSQTLLFLHALRRDRLDEALFYWPGVRDRAELKRRDKLRFIELLRLRGDIAKALRFWREVMGTEALLYNGDFAEPPLKTAFGWRVGSPKGTSWELAGKTSSGAGAFHLHFAGSENVNYRHLYQCVVPAPLPAAGEDTAGTVAGEGGRNFVLVGEVRCRGLTTGQRPYFEVVGTGVGKPWARTEMFAAVQDFTPFRLEFSVPADCQQLLVRLRRDRSRDINCLIAGDIWISKLRLTAQD